MKQHMTSLLHEFYHTEVSFILRATLVDSLYVDHYCWNSVW